MKMLADKKIVASWTKNATSWIKAIEQNEIESRTLTTNYAILNQIKKYSPNSILDLGCGEGWLARALKNLGTDYIGIDAIPELIKYAKNKGGGRFKLLTYEQISTTSITKKFNLVVCNFSLIGKESVNHLFQQVPFFLHKNGIFIIQTIHPKVVSTASNYKDGWREGSWDGFSENFLCPAPWYFRTMDSWENLFKENDFEIIDTLEPINIKTHNKASIIYVGKKKTLFN